MIFVDLGDFHFNQINSYPLFFLSPISLGIFLIWVFSYIEYKIYQWPPVINPILWISKNGITILATHIYLIILISIITEKLNITNITIDFIITFACISGILYCIATILNKNLPWIVGKQ